MSHARHAPGLLGRLRTRATKAVFESAFRSAAALGRYLPEARATSRMVEVLPDIPYHDTGSDDHLLDIYRPTGAAPGELLPVIFYVHGGGFHILSKDTHWVMGYAFARRGFMVVSINYRLAPQHRFPAAVEDACTALTWVVENIARYGGDPKRIVLAGESAGANLVTSLAIASSYRRSEPHARAVFDSGVRPLACLPACGILQVSDGARFGRRRRLPGIVAARILEISTGYLGGHPAPPGHEDLDLADPLVFLERGLPPERPLPPFFAPVGTADPILDDTRRLAAALARLGVPCRAEYYPGEPHAFHALIWRENARHCWAHCFEFLHEHIGVPAPEAYAPRHAPAA
jgi:acetyl esterase